MDPFLVKHNEYSYENNDILFAYFNLALGENFKLLNILMFIFVVYAWY